MNAFAGGTHLGSPLQFARLPRAGIRAGTPPAACTSTCTVHGAGSASRRSAHTAGAGEAAAIGKCQLLIARAYSAQNLCTRKVHGYRILVISILVTTTV